ncbi:hypothetical protein TNCV_2654641 [Trichonephila clavipes]|nr:hypothetical protein TNCV_2654641 [Trichonephila clavipes]
MHGLRNPDLYPVPQVAPLPLRDAICSLSPGGGQKEDPSSILFLYGNKRRCGGMTAAESCSAPPGVRQHPAVPQLETREISFASQGLNVEAISFPSYNNSFI